MGTNIEGKNKLCKVSIQEHIMRIFKKEQTTTFTEHADAPLYWIDVHIGKKFYPKVMKCVLTPEKSEILIGDIHFKNTDKLWNRGYGSEMMSRLLAYAKANGYHRVTGNLTDVDYDHRDRQIHFYEKFGFAVIPVDGRKQMKIELSL